MNIRQTRQHTERDLHCIFKIEATFFPDGIQKQGTSVKLCHQIMVDRIAFFHLAIVNIADDVDVFVGIQFLAELDLIDLLALEELFTRNALELVDLHEIHHIVWAKSCI